MQYGKVKEDSDRTKFTSSLMRINKVEDIIMGKGYGLGSFLIDLFLTSITGGLWLLFLLIRFIKR